MPALSLPAVGSLQGQSGIALPAHLLITVVFLGNGSNGRIHDTAPQSQDQVQGGFLLDVVIGEGSAVYACN